MKTPNKELRSGRSLSTTLAIAFSAISAAVLLISGGLHIFFSFQNRQDAISNEQRIIAQEPSKQVSDFIQEKFSVLETVSQMTDLIAASPEEREDTLNSILEPNPAFRQLILLDDEKKELARVSRVSEAGPAGTILDDRALIRLWQDGRYIGPVYIDESTREPLVKMSVAENTASGAFQGILVAEVDLKIMWTLIEQIEISEQGLAYVVDRDGNLIAHIDTARVLQGENVSQLPVVRDFIDNPATDPSTSVHTYQGTQGNLVVGTYVPLVEPDWAVVTEVPWSEAYQQVIQEVLPSIVVTLIMTVLAGLMGVFLARRLAVPLVKLNETATRIADGDRMLQAEVSGPKEVVTLAMSFNSMTAQLHDLIDTLEQRVAARTAELEQKAVDLARVSQYKSDFLASMSHELRTPLNAILTFNELLAIGTFGPVNEEQVDYLQKSLQSGKYLLSLINDVLDVAKIQSGKMKLFLEDNFDVAAELKDVVGLAAMMLRDKPIALTTEFDSEFPPMCCDKRRVRQVLLNLISNAVKFTERGFITLSARNHGSEVVFAVADTGPGVGPEEQALIFEPFVQADSGIQHANGTGLGLPITKGLVEAHGGRIWMESTPGKGSKFYVSLPVSQVEAAGVKEP